MDIDNDFRSYALLVLFTFSLAFLKLRKALIRREITWNSGYFVGCERLCLVLFKSQHIHGSLGCALRTDYSIYAF